VTLRIGTRGSALALWQANFIADRLREEHPELETEIITFKTTGDNILDRPLAEIGGKGLFTKELEVALYAGDIEIAVHSLKDMPTALPEGLILGAIPNRADVRDCILSRPNEPIEPNRVGTASLRRASLALRRWPECGVESIRGNIQTRMNRLYDDGSRRMDVVILAMAGVLRMKFPEERPDVSFLPLNPEQWIPAVGQGALAIECRQDDVATLERLAPLHNPNVAACTAAERQFLRAVEGDCRVPVGALATADRGQLRLRAFIGATDGSEILVETAFGEDPEELGGLVAQRLLDAGGAEILRALRAGD
jgi:hydroxymethylbilane synthase